MEKMHFEILIKANPEKVWNAVVDDSLFREWTSVFSPNSYFEGGWQKGDRIKFISLNEKGEKEGMVAEIADNRKYSYISIRHLGIIQNGVEDTTSELVKEWVPAYENYTLSEMADKTRFEVDVDVNENYLEMFTELWPKALKKLKEIAEK